jgi:hypothetical protein
MEAYGPYCAERATAHDALERLKKKNDVLADFLLVRKSTVLPAVLSQWHLAMRGFESVPQVGSLVLFG